MTHNKKKPQQNPLAFAEETYVSNTTPDDYRHQVNQSQKVFNCYKSYKKLSQGADDDRYSSYASVDDSDSYPLANDQQQLRQVGNDKKITIDVFPV